MKRIISISITVSGAGTNMLNIEQWKGIPVNTRISHVLKNEVVFIDESGERVPVKEALEYINSL